MYVCLCVYVCARARAHQINNSETTTLHRSKPRIIIIIIIIVVVVVERDDLKRKKIYYRLSNNSFIFRYYERNRNSIAKAVLLLNSQCYLIEIVGAFTMFMKLS